MDDIESKTSFMFKTIMCPLGDACPKVKKARWPSSSIKTVTKFGALCPYAHHLMELEFPATLETKINAAASIQKQIKQAVEHEKAQDAFIPGGPKIHYQPKGPGKTTEQKKTNHEKLRKLLKSVEDPNLTTYFTEMKDIQQKLNIDDNYCKKFGLLKKASVLSFYGRSNEAFNEIAKAVAIIKEQKQHDGARNEAIQKRWKFKLGLDDGFELPFPIEKVHPDDIDYK